MLRWFSAILLFFFVFAWLPLPGVSSQPAEPARGGVRVLVNNDSAEDLNAVRADGGKLLARYDAFSLWRIPGQVRAAARLQRVNDRIVLRGLAFRPQDGEPPIPARLRQEHEEVEGFWLIQFSGPVQPGWIQELNALQLEIVSYLPDYAYVVWGSQPAGTLNAWMRRSDVVEWTGAYHPYYRLAPALRGADIQRPPGTMVDVTIQLYQTSQSEETLRQITRIAQDAATVRIDALKLVNLRAKVPARSIPDVAAWPGVLNVEPYQPPTLLDEAQGQILAGNISPGGSLLAPSGPGYLDWLASKGFPDQPDAYPLVDVMDDGLDAGNAGSIQHPDFSQSGDPLLPDRIPYIRNCSTDASGSSGGGHGNINAGIAAGYNDRTGFPYKDAAGYQYGLGISPYGQVAATKIFTNNGNYSISLCGFSLSEPVEMAYTGGARITSNSWGSTVSGAYDSDAQLYDLLTRDASPQPGNQEMLHVVAAGNAGPTSGSINSPGTAKNVITVGASENVRENGVLDGCGFSAANNAGDIASFSSRGPAKDGRAKPDLVAPGTHIQGPATQDGSFTGGSICGSYSGSDTRYYPLGQTLYTWSSGTSHSTPAVSGAAQLIHEYYGRVLQPGQSPSPAMVKVLMVNTSRTLSGLSVGDSYPGAGQGWGTLNLGMTFDDTPRILNDQDHVFAGSGESFEVFGMVAQPEKPLRVSLAWTDAPGSTAAGAAAVNDLDLEVTIGGQVYRGNVFQGATSAGGGSFDSLNNLENVFLSAGTEGPFTVRVIARSINGNAVLVDGDQVSQDFALAIYNGTQEVRPILTTAGATWSEYEGNQNGYIDPGETIDVLVSVKNAGNAPAENVSAVLGSASKDISVIDAHAQFLKILPGETLPALQSFRLKVSKTMPCSGSLPLSLGLSYNAYQTERTLSGLSIGQPILHHYDAADIPIPIPDYSGGIAGSAEAVIEILTSRFIQDLDISVDIQHTYSGDLEVELVTPGGSGVTLANGIGGSGDGYTGTIFDDEAEVSINQGDPPFTGQHKPEGFLSTVDGTDTAGLWRLVVTDHAPADIGTIQAFSLDITETQCAPYSISFTVQTAQGNDFLSGPAGSTILVEILVKNFSQDEEFYSVSILSKWTVAGDSVIGPVAPGETVSAIFEVAIPPGTPPGTIDAVHIILVPQKDPSARAEVSAEVLAIAQVWLPYLSNFTP